MIFQILVHFQESLDFEKNNPEFKNNHITPYLQGAPTCTYYKQYVRLFPRNIFYAEKIDHMFQIALRPGRTYEK